MQKITEIFAFVATEPDGEGLAAARINEHWMPLIGADAARVESLREIAQGISNQTGYALTLARFSLREDLETITPQAKQ